MPPLALGKSPAMPVANSIAAERAKHAGTFGRPREGFDTFDKIGAGLYIDA